MKNNDLMKVISHLLLKAFTLAEKAHEYSFEVRADNEYNEPPRPDDKCAALSYAAACTAKYTAAEAIYLTAPELKQVELSELFARFEVFVREIQDSYSANGSRQWVSIHFEKLKPLYEEFACNYPAEA